MADNDQEKFEMPLTRKKYLKLLQSLNKEGNLPHQQISSNRRSYVCRQSLPTVHFYCSWKCNFMPLLFSSILFCYKCYIYIYTRNNHEWVKYISSYFVPHNFKFTDSWISLRNALPKLLNYYNCHYVHLCPQFSLWRPTFK